MTSEQEFKSSLRSLLDERKGVMSVLSAKAEYSSHDEELLERLADINDNIKRYHATNPFWWHQVVTERGVK